MPGSSIIQTGLSNVYNSRYLATNNWNVSVFSGLTIVNDTLTVEPPAQNFPFATGDRVYFFDSTVLASLPDAANNYQFTLYYAIRISATQIKLATSYENAIAGTAITIADFTNKTVSGTNFNNRVISNVTAPVINRELLYDNTSFFASKWNSSAVSSQSFFISDQVRLEFDLPECSMAGLISLEKRETGIPVYGFGLLRPGSKTLLGIGDTFSNMTDNICGRSITGETSADRFFFPFSPGWNGRLRITVQNNTISVAMSVNNGATFTTMFTTSQLSITSPLNFFAYNSLNNTGLTNCTINYNF